MRADFGEKYRILSSINIAFLCFLYLIAELFCNSVLCHFVPCDPKVTQKIRHTPMQSRGGYFYSLQAITKPVAVLTKP